MQPHVSSELCKQSASREQAPPAPLRALFSLRLVASAVGRRGFGVIPPSRLNCLQGGQRVAGIGPLWRGNESHPFLPFSPHLCGGGACLVERC